MPNNVPAHYQRARDFCLDDEVVDAQAYERLKRELAELRAAHATQTHNIQWLNSEYVKIEAERDKFRTYADHLAATLREVEKHLADYVDMCASAGGEWASPRSRALLAKVREALSRNEGNTSGHASDCAVHNAPALPVGPCDCGFK